MKDAYFMAIERFRVRRLDWEAADLERMIQDVLHKMNKATDRYVWDIEGDDE